METMEWKPYCRCGHAAPQHDNIGGCAECSCFRYRVRSTEELSIDEADTIRLHALGVAAGG